MLKSVCIVGLTTFFFGQSFGLLVYFVDKIIITVLSLSAAGPYKSQIRANLKTFSCFVANDNNNI